jgi:hypothetical protein
MMATTYIQSSSFMEIPVDQLKQAEELCGKIIEEIIEQQGYCPCLEWETKLNYDTSGIWFYNEECFDPEVMKVIAEKMVETLKLNEPFIVSWAYTCSKPEIDGFGGGAFVKEFGYEIYAVDARCIVEQAKQIGIYMVRKNEK